MRVLLIHHDFPVTGGWSQGRWELCCSVRRFYGFGEGPEDFRTIAQILSPGLGILVDEHGLDWWEILAPLRLFEVLQAMIMKSVAREAKGAEQRKLSNPIEAGRLEKLSQSA